MVRLNGAAAGAVWVTLVTRIILGFGMAFAAFLCVLNVITVVALAHWAWDNRGRRIKWTGRP